MPLQGNSEKILAVIVTTPCQCDLSQSFAASDLGLWRIPERSMHRPFSEHISYSRNKIYVAVCRMVSCRAISSRRNDKLDCTMPDCPHDRCLSHKRLAFQTENTRSHLMPELLVKKSVASSVNYRHANFLIRLQ